MAKQEFTFTDEQLMAYADGQSDAVLTSKIEMAIKENKMVAERVDMFRSSSALLKQAFQPISNPAADSKLIDMIRRASENTEAENATTSNVIKFPAQKKAAVNYWQQSIAASVLLAVGLAGGYLLGSPLPGQTPNLVSAALEASVQSALTTLATGESRNDGGTGITVVASFKNPSGKLCREFELNPVGSGKSVAIACRSDKQWQTVLQVAMPTASDVFTPAGGQQTLDAYLQAAGMGEPLSPDEEKAALAQ